MIDLGDEANRAEFTKKLTKALAKTDSVPELIDQTSMEYESEKFIKPAHITATGEQETMKITNQDCETEF